MRRIFANKVENLRDIGGYAINNTEIVKEGCLFRGNCITSLTSEELNYLIQWRITKVIDLRCEEEIQKKKSVFWQNDKFSYVNIAINGNGKLPENKEKVLDSYIEMLDGKEQIKKFFDTLAETEENILYYCNAGKDRTGVITACILQFLGVSNDDIIVDYLASGVYLKNMLQEFAKSMPEKDIYSIINPNYNTMHNLLHYIDCEYGSIEKYLISCNISNKNLKKIKNKYTKKMAPIIASYF